MSDEQGAGSPDRMERELVEARARVRDLERELAAARADAFAMVAQTQRFTRDLIYGLGGFRPSFLEGLAPIAPVVTELLRELASRVGAEADDDDGVQDDPDDDAFDLDGDLDDDDLDDADDPDAPSDDDETAALDRIAEMFDMTEDYDLDDLVDRVAQAIQ